MDNILKQLDELSASLKSAEAAYNWIYGSKITRGYWKTVDEKINSIKEKVKELHA